MMMGTPAFSQQSGSPAEQTVAHKYFTDVELINQDNQKMRLYSDLMKGKIVIINSFYTSDQGSSLLMNRNLKAIQEALGERVGKDVIIFSISVDPTIDTPALLKEYAKKLGSKPGWHFLSGDKKNVEFALKKFGQYVENKQDHSNIILIGNEPTGLWTKALGLEKSDDLIKVVWNIVGTSRSKGQANSTLSFEAKHVFKPGDVLAQTTFYLLDDSVQNIMTTVDLTSSVDFGDSLYDEILLLTYSYKDLERYNVVYTRIMKAIKPHVIATVTTDSNGKGQFEAVPAGTYYLFGIGDISKALAFWDLEVDLKSGQNSLTLDRKNKR
jgi:protein SCO1/2